MPEPRTFATRHDGEMTAAQIYAECRRKGGFMQGSLVNPEGDWAALTSALRRIAKTEGLQVSTFTERPSDRRRSWGHRPTRQVQIHKDGLLAYPDTITQKVQDHA